MSFMRLQFSSDAGVPLASLAAGARGTVMMVHDVGARVERLLALGVAPGACITVLQTSPAIVFLCDQTELAVERGVADSIFVRVTAEPEGRA